MDTTGATSDVGKDYAIGMSEAWKYINSQGGVNGKKIKYTWFAYGYRIPEAITKYKRLLDIIGSEDHFGDMDFKLCGTSEGVTGYQLDLKLPGIPLDLRTHEQSIKGICPR